MISLLKEFFSMFLGIHFHEWGNWEDVGYGPKSTIQQRECNGCGMKKERRVTRA